MKAPGPLACVLWVGMCMMWHFASATEPEAGDRRLPELIQAALDAGQREIRVPAGTYRVSPVDGTHLALRNLEGVTLDLRGVEMICTETTRAVLIENCRDLVLRGLTIDYDPLPFTQGELVEISEDRKTHILQLEEGFPPAERAIDFKYILYTPEGELRYGEYFRRDVEPLPGNRLKISGLHPHKDGGERVGDRAVVGAAFLRGRYIPHAVHLLRASGTRLEDVTLYSSPCFGFFEQHSNGSIYRGCVVDRRPGRLLSLNADAFHSKFAQVGPRIEGCRAFHQGDDAVNICGAYHLVLGSDGPRLRVLAKRDMDIRAGDPVQLVGPDGRALPEAVAVAVRKVGPASEADLETAASFPLLPTVIRLLEEEFEIELDRAVEVGAGGVVGSLNRMGNGFVIRDCHFGHNRSRGILVKAGDGRIENNTLDHCHMQAIKIAPEYLWLESGYSRDVVVRDNRILHPGREGILVGGVGPHPLHQDIRITDNFIQTSHAPAVRIQAVDGGAFRDNRIEMREGTAGAEFVIEHSRALDVDLPDAGGKSGSFFRRWRKSWFR